MLLGSLGINIICKFVRNDSGSILTLLDIDPESFSDVKVYMLNTYLTKNSHNEKISKYDFKSQHLAINPGPGPPLQSAPGQDDVEDFNIIKNY